LSSMRFGLMAFLSLLSKVMNVKTSLDVK
jgi:hypothetical protein